MRGAGRDARTAADHTQDTQAGKWVADVAYTQPEPEPTSSQGIMGVDLGVKVPAMVHIIGKGSRFFFTMPAEHAAEYGSSSGLSLGTA